MANGDPIYIGQENTGNSTTILSRNVASHETVFVARNLNAGGGIGVAGRSMNSIGVSGRSSLGIGVHGFSFHGLGVAGRSNSSTGVQGVSTSGLGVRGTSTNSVAVSGFSFRSFGGFFRGPPSTTGSSGSLRLLGTVVKSQGEYSEALPHPDGSQRLLYAPLSPESWYEDFGRGELVEGRGQVEFDPDFAAILGIDDGHYHVFLTPEGDSNGLYVSSRRPTAFEVHEQQGGTSSLTFSYRVVAKRKDAQPERLAKLEEPESMPEPASPAARGIDFARLEEVHRREMEELRRRMEERQEGEPPEST
jgi:hypothetical protein